MLSLFSSFTFSLLMCPFMGPACRNGMYNPAEFANQVRLLSHGRVRVGIKEYTALLASASFCTALRYKCIGADVDGIKSCIFVHDGRPPFVQHGPYSGVLLSDPKTVNMGNVHT